MMILLLITATMELAYIFAIHALLKRERMTSERWMRLADDAMTDVRRASFLMAETEREVEKLENEAKRLVSVLEDNAKVASEPPYFFWTRGE